MSKKTDSAALGELKIRDLGPDIGTEIEGFGLPMLADETTADKLLYLFDTRGVLVFRDLDLSYDEQVEVSLFLIRRSSSFAEETFNDRWYISNRRPDSRGTARTSPIPHRHRLGTRAL